MNVSPDQHDFGYAVFPGRLALRPVEHRVLTTNSPPLTEGFWVVTAEFEGHVQAWRMSEVRLLSTCPVAELAQTGGEVTNPGPQYLAALADLADAGFQTSASWQGPDPAAWTSSADSATYQDGVEQIRRAIREGEVYQVNLCRMLSAPLPGPRPNAAALGSVLAGGNPAPWSAVIDLPGQWVVSASPELFLAYDGAHLYSSPIKGTAPTAEELLEKDTAENIMIADLVRNDLARVCTPGTVEVTSLLRTEEHPGLVHLVTTVRGELQVDPADWPLILAQTFAPASVSGAPKIAAVSLISELESAPRGPYCGGLGWVEILPDGASRAALNVGIRTFFWRNEELHFGTGAGITWQSDPAGEWAETELKAAKLIDLASGSNTQP